MTDLEMMQACGGLYLIGYADTAEELGVSYSGQDLSEVIQLPLDDPEYLKECRKLVATLIASWESQGYTEEMVLSHFDGDQERFLWLCIMQQAGHGVGPDDDFQMDNIIPGFDPTPEYNEAWEIQSLAEEHARADSCFKSAITRGMRF